MDDVGEEVPTHWMDPRDLLRLVRRDVEVTGDESPEAVLLREPTMLVSVSAAQTPALDLTTYRVRMERWEDGQGPRLAGMREFVNALETLTEPTRAATVSGARTTYTFLLDEAMTRVLAAVAVDEPAAG